jgi:hypothetical protein
MENQQPFFSPTRAQFEWPNQGNRSGAFGRQTAGSWIVSYAVMESGVSRSSFFETWRSSTDAAGRHAKKHKRMLMSYATTSLRKVA